MSNCTERENLKNKFCFIKDLKKLNNMSIPEIIAYVKKLHRFMEKREKKLKKYKDKVKIWEKKCKKLKRDSLLEKTDDVEILNSRQIVTKIPNGKENDKLGFVDQIREAAETAQKETGFIYEPISGLYYDKNSGYYYNAEYGLYYDGNTGCYYKFNQEKNEFEFHSQTISRSSKTDQAQQDAYKAVEFINGKIVNDGEQDYLLSKIGQKNVNENLVKKRKMKTFEDCSYDIQFGKNREDGEISSTESEEGDIQQYEIIHYQDIAKRYPPSLRIIVQETNLDKIKIGTLYIITFKGGTLGREGNHDVLIPDINISKFHLKFTYNEEKGTYQCVDLGSRNGTLLNGKRISSAKQESKLTDIAHGSILQISQTKLICHIHSGNTSCGLCEPGLLVETKNFGKVELLSHKQQLKKLQKRYGLENEKYADQKLVKENKYKDRASYRRVKIGSSSQHEKTEVSSTETQISTTNKGFKILSKLGWKEGEALGKEKVGLLQPITVISNEGTAGLGCKIFQSPNLTKPELKKIKQWKKAQERYEKISQTDIFCDKHSDSDD